MEAIVSERWQRHFIRLGSVHWAAYAPTSPPDSESPAVIYLHGFTGDHQDLHLLAHHNPSVTQWHALEWLGHGASDAPSCGDCYRLEWQMAALELLIARIGSQQTVLIGYSMGARLALHYACRHPRQQLKLMQIGGSPGINDPQQRDERAKLDLERSRRILSGDWKAFAKEWSEQPLLRSQHNIAAPFGHQLAERRVSQDPVGMALSIAHLSPGILPSLWPKLDGIHHPPVLVAGAADPRYADIARRMARQMPQAVVEIIPNAGHTAHLENPSVFLNVLRIRAVNVRG